MFVIILWIWVLGTYKFAIKSVNLLKYFKSSSLFCNDCHNLPSLLQHFTVTMPRALMTSANAECRVSHIIHRYVATHYCLDQFLASLIWPDPILMHAGAFIISTLFKSLCLVSNMSNNTLLMWSCGNLLATYIMNWYGIM